MIRALIGKELSEHLVSLIAIALLLGIGFFTILSNTLFASDDPRPFQAFRMFLLSFMVLTVLILGNRLVVKEYQAKTQLFLETLPLSRIGMISTKFFLGLSVVLGATMIAYAVAALMSSRIDDLSWRFNAIILSKSLSFTMFVYSFCFMMGLMGRYRVAIYILLFIAFAIIHSATAVEVFRFGPFGLLDERFAYEREDFPHIELMQTWISIGVLVAVTILLSVVREGNVAAMLAEKMSHREKVFVTCIIFGMLFLGSVLDSAKTKEPFDLIDGISANHQNITLKISRPLFSDDQEAAQRIADDIADEIAEFCKFLNISSLPPIFLVQRSDLDADQYERGSIQNAEGFLARANFDSPEWQSGDFKCWLVAEIVAAETSGRALAEPVRWVLDGLPVYWAKRRDYRYSGANSQQMDLRIALAMQRGFTNDDYQRWFRYREKVGNDMAEAMAWNGLAAIEEAKGSDAIQEFLRRILKTNVPADVRATLYSWHQSIPRVAQRQLGMTESEIVNLWIERAQAIVERNADRLSRIPHFHTSIEYPKLSAGSRQVQYTIECLPEPENGKFAIRYAELPAFDAELSIDEPKVETLRYDLHRSGILEETFPRRTRFIYTFSAYSEIVGCDVISGWIREEMP